MRKRATQGEVVALRALAEVTAAPALPELLAAGTDADGPWVMTPFYAGSTLRSEAHVSDEVIESLARLHAHYLGTDLVGLPVVDRELWRGVCRHVSKRLYGLLTEDQLHAPITLVDGVRDDPVLIRTLDRLPRTLVHGDMHANNVLGLRGYVQVVRSLLIAWPDELQWVVDRSAEVKRLHVADRVQLADPLRVGRR